MSLNITLVENDTGTASPPGVRGLRELLIYLSEQPHLSEELREEAKNLIQHSAEIATEIELGALEQAVQEFVFRLEHADQRYDIAREALLRRLLNKLLDVYKNVGPGANPFTQRAEILGEKVLRATQLADLERLHQDVLQLVRDVHTWQFDESHRLTALLRAVAEQVIRGMALEDPRYEEHNAKIETLATRIKRAEAAELQEVAAKLQEVLVAQNNIYLHHRIERLELQQVSLALGRAIQALSDCNAEFQQALASVIDTAAANAEHPTVAIQTKAVQMQKALTQFEEKVAALRGRIDKVQLRIPLPDDELAQAVRMAESSLTPEDKIPVQAIQARFERELEIAAEIFTRHRTPYCLCIIRLDNFYHLREEYGPKICEKIVRHITTFLKTELRKIDLVFHFADDQFGVILPNTTVRGAYLVMERIFLAIESMQFIFKNQCLRVHSYIGISDLTPEMSPNGWLHAAIEASFEAEKLCGIRIKAAARS